ncbi:TPA: hypothetical protein U1B40_001394 [Streptococcus suis]|uniref:HNH endonuclease n=1 Tax=Streptococcus suis TaxID=1307 RepID=UPI000F66BBF6|nr:HNH endonuclease [Streptococcus suis]MBM7138591.1 hypothetical protein [Streptococcus suis]MBY4601606.1 hypothetical protein [Streptococcus suis]MCO8173403.1 hypothetical protein [Streptococcus suis]MCO8181787.1 hypothetical protein [Streptococcus suis]MCO8192447.1 hypothetical protein [Streptococcus suis]
MAASKSKRSRREFFKNNVAVNEKDFPSDEFEVHHVIEWAEIDEENHLSRQKIDTYKNMLLLSKEVHKEITRKTNSSRASNRGQYGVTPRKFYKVEIYDDIEEILVKLINIMDFKDFIELKYGKDIFFDLKNKDIILKYNEEMLEEHFG